MQARARRAEEFASGVYAGLDLGQKNDADAYRDACLLAGVQVFHGPSDPLGEVDGFRPRPPDGENDELVTAAPGERVFDAEKAADAGGDCAKKAIARGAAVANVDLIEAVRVDRQHAEGGPVASCVGDLVNEPFVERHAVVRECQRVVSRRRRLCGTGDREARLDVRTQLKPVTVAQQRYTDGTRPEERPQIGRA